VTLQEIADGINTLFKDYGLDHDVVEVLPESHPNQLDPRENEPDPTKWRSLSRIAHPEPYLALTHSYNPVDMELLLQTLQYVFGEYFTLHPPSNQMRLF
jgi:hypothetical protein